MADEFGIGNSEFGITHRNSHTNAIGGGMRNDFFQGQKENLENSAPDRQQSSERGARALGMGMVGFLTAKVDDFAVTVDCSLLIFATMRSQVTLHQPCLGMIRIDIEYSVDENLGNFPSFFRNCSCSM